ncbi:unnamed protein product [Blepharisma stoltei]|uniref:Biogenesis of lysosome-related organelles complex 1 subunit 1 n=1 Tax=Blepharisma stoltei TaxID=1481888 RepID=A0AAU9J7C7_9CILI|nr:unnamed protein product [Blepharisma stoltei]
MNKYAFIQQISHYKNNYLIIMFTEITKEYDQRRAELKYRSSQARQELNKLSGSLSTHILNSLNSQVEALHENQKQIEVQTKQFRQESTKLATQTKKWITMYDQLNDALKQVGDIVNWAEIIENDMNQVASAVSKLVEGNDLRSN